MLSQFVTYMDIPAKQCKKRGSEMMLFFSVFICLATLYAIETENI